VEVQEVQDFQDFQDFPAGLPGHFLDFQQGLPGLPQGLLRTSSRDFQQDFQTSSRTWYQLSGCMPQ
jgi:hypothetical protein